MNTRQILAAGVCLGLAACGANSISARNARWYDPQLVRDGGPVDITLVGAQGAEQAAVLATISDALRANGAQAGAVKPVGAPDRGYRVAVLYGPVAHDLTASGDADNYSSSCRTINSQAGASLAASASPAGGGMPVLALLCHGSEYEALAYANLGDSDSLASAMPGMVTQLFPPPGAND